MELERQLPKNIQQRPRLAGKEPLDKFEKREIMAHEQKRLNDALVEAAFEGRIRECLLLLEKGAQANASAVLLAKSESQAKALALFDSMIFLQEQLLKETYRAFLSAFVECTA